MYAKCQACYCMRVCPADAVIALSRSPPRAGAGGPGGVAPSPNIPLGGGTGDGWKLCTNSWCNGEPVASGTLPAPWKVGEWHTLSLTVVGATATATMDGKLFYSGGTAVPKQPSPPSIDSTPASCEANMTILPHGEMLVGNDYRQAQLQSDPADVKHCVQDCCNDPKCTAWAVAMSGLPTSPTCTHGTVCCFLKTGSPSKQAGTGEIAAGMRPIKPTPAQPPLPFGGTIPTSGWAALVTTLGGVQYDNFKLEGRAVKGGGAVNACGTGLPEVGSAVVATPCDAPNALHAWDKLVGGQLQLQSTQLCIGASTSGSAVLIPCSGSEDNARVSGPQLVHNRTTGMIGDGSNCVDVLGSTEQGGQWPSAVANAKCAAIPTYQQFQFNPQTGALRPKGSKCVADFKSTVNQYRDCCLSVCP
jgi:hypothetical protein